MPEALTDGGPPVPLIPPPAPKDAHFLRLRLPAKIPHKREPASSLTTRGASNPDNVWACQNPRKAEVYLGSRLEPSSTGGAAARFSRRRGCLRASERLDH